MASVYRQLQDIQFQATKFLDSRTYDFDIDSFVIYVEETKSFLLETETNEIILKLVSEIPVFDSNTNKSVAVKKSLMTYLTGIVGVLAQREIEKEEVNSYLRDVKSKFSSIEFIMKSNS